MKKIILRAVMGVFCLSPLFAQAIGTTFANGSVYAVVPYGNNPFLFCTQGMPTDGWKAVNPATGSWTVIHHHPNLYWVATYEFICPRGFIK